ncbi:MAG: DUF547 domain-containing protein [Ignavibacteria bacterium]|nr:DUF547 domain-containing protein [Ignavibacteria bacterium]
MINISMMGFLLFAGLFAFTDSHGQKPHKYTTKNKSESGLFDSLMKQCFKNNTLRCDSCDTILLRRYLKESSIYAGNGTRNQQARLCTLINVYHAWLILTLCTSNGLQRITNDTMLLNNDTLMIDKSKYTLETLRTSILEMAQKEQLLIWCSLWNGTVSGASHPKKEFLPKTFSSTIKAKAKAYFKSSHDEYSLDRSKGIISLSESLLRELSLIKGGTMRDALYILEVILPFIPESDAAYCLVNKHMLRVRSIVVSDRIPIAQ